MKKSIILFLLVILLLSISLSSALAQSNLEIEIPIQVSPHVIVMFSNSGSVTVHADIAYSSVDGDSVTLEEIPAYLTKADDRGQLVAKFSVTKVKALGPGDVELSLKGDRVDDSDTKIGTFIGNETIKIITCESRGMNALFSTGKKVGGRSSIFSRVCDS